MFGSTTNNCAKRTTPDYELLFTLPSDGVKKLSRQFEKAKALVTHIGEITESASKVSLLRQNGKKVTIYPDKAKINKQFSYADKHKVNYAILMGLLIMKNKLFYFKIEEVIPLF